VISNLPVINVYKKKKLKSEVVTQLLYGDIFKKLEKKGTWIKIKNNADNYKGYIRNRKFPLKKTSSHKVCNLYATLYSKPSTKKKIRKKLSFGSKIKTIEKKGLFYKFDNFWIKKSDLKDINYKTENPFRYIKKFINTKYKWGGKSFNGIDCSALVQLFFNFNNKFCPRDAKDQVGYFRKKVALKNIRKNDLIFWRGHVGVAISKHNMIHAYGPLKKTLVMPTKKTIEKIYNTANLRVIGIRRTN